MSERDLITDTVSSSCSWINSRSRTDPRNSQQLGYLSKSDHYISITKYRFKMNCKSNTRTPALIYFLHLESELRVVEDVGMFYCVLVSINIPFEPLDQILFHMHFKQNAFGISTWLLCLIFLLSFRSITGHIFFKMIVHYI